jgi:colanic acid biosynthesis glycosyl transferase WcaI
MPCTLLIISQTFPPDPAAVGQYMADVAVAMAKRGHAVRVYTQDRGYEDPSLRFPRRENLSGADVRRFQFASFGKKTILTRLIGTASFMVQSFWVILTTPNLAGVFFSTSPPMIGMVAAVAGMLRRVPVAYWAMDLNPDQLYALGKLKPADFTARLIERVNRFILRRSSLVITLDRYMADALRRRGVGDDKLLVVPPWPHEEHLAGGDGEQFRRKHGLEGKFVIMYSGNHTPSNPLDTLLRAAEAFADDPDIRFVFVGGGLLKKDVDAATARLPNILSLPYQPFAELKHSLRAADVHVVSLGDPMVGVVHPCKIYGAMAIARPVLYLGPESSHIADLLKTGDFGWHISHGDVAGAVATIRAVRSAPDLRSKGEHGQQLLAAELSQAKLQAEFCERLERQLVPRPSGPC